MNTTDVFILGLLTGVAIIYFIQKKFSYYKKRKILMRAKKAELDAMSFLEKHGYRIEAVQESKEVITEVDGKSKKNKVIADYIVKKGKKKYVVEVKTGKQTDKITASGIRRQLLEYFLIFQPHGIILLDMENKKLQHINFKYINTIDSLNSTISIIKKIVGYFLILILGFIIGYIYNT